MAPHRSGARGRGVSLLLILSFVIIVGSGRGANRGAMNHINYLRCHNPLTGAAAGHQLPPLPQAPGGLRRRSAPRRLGLPASGGRGAARSRGRERAIAGPPAPAGERKGGRHLRSAHPPLTPSSVHLLPQTPSHLTFPPPPLTAAVRVPHLVGAAAGAGREAAARSQRTDAVLRLHLVAGVSALGVE